MADRWRKLRIRAHKRARASGSRFDRYPPTPGIRARRPPLWLPPWALLPFASTWRAIVLALFGLDFGRRLFLLTEIARPRAIGTSSSRMSRARQPHVRGAIASGVRNGARMPAASLAALGSMKALHTHIAAHAPVPVV